MKNRKLCPNCNTENQADSQYCSECGASLDSIETAKPSLPVANPLERPGFITAYAILLGMGAGFSILMILGVFISNPRGFSYALKLTRDSALALSYFFGMAIILSAFAFGLWRLREWARLGMIGFLMLGLLITLPLNPAGLIIALPISGYVIYWLASNGKYFNDVSDVQLFKEIGLWIIIAAVGYAVIWSFRISEQGREQKDLAVRATATSQIMAEQSTTLARVLVKKIYLPGDCGGTGLISYSPDGTKLVTIADNKALVWNIGIEGANDAQQIASLEHSSDSNEYPLLITGMNYSPNGLTLTTVDNRGTVKIWDTQTWREYLTFTIFKRDEFPKEFQAVYSPDGQHIAVTGGQSSEATIWDVNTGKQLLALKNNDDCINFLAYSPDGHSIVTACRMIQVWEAETGRPTIKIANGDRTYGVNRIIYSPDGHKIISINDLNAPTIWDADTWKDRFTVKVGNENFTYTIFSPDGHNIVTATGQGRTTIRNAATGEMVSVLIQGSYIYFITYSPDGENIITLSNCQLMYWNATVLKNGGLFDVRMDIKRQIP